MAAMWWWPAVAAALGAAAAEEATAVAPRAGRHMMDHPQEFRQRNWLRITKHTCDECVTMEEFYQEHPLNFVLFFERALGTPNSYKAAVVSGFFEACADMRYSHVPCGVVDLLDDKEYAERYIKPETAPAHIVVRDGKPVKAAKHQIEPLLEKPGKKDLILWHLNQLLVPEEENGALEVSREVSDLEDFTGYLKKHELVVVCGGSSRLVREAFRAVAQRLVMTDNVPLELRPAKPPGPPAKDKRGKKRERADRRRRRVLFLALTGKAAKALKPEGEDAVVGVYIRGELQPDRGTLKPKSAKNETEVKEVVVKVAKPAADAAQAAILERAEL